jgi:riboflavin synthase
VPLAVSDIIGAMFTGLIEEVGTVASVKNAKQSHKLRITSSELIKELKVGDSIAVSGVCLTAVSVDRASFEADLAQETLYRTSFSRIRAGALVNLELPMRANARLGGHIVQGHVDGTGKFLSLDAIAEGQDSWLRIEVPHGLEKYVIAKGSLSVEGISLTVTKIAGQEVTIAVIPHTAEATNLKSLRPGDPVNLEVDVIAKYVEKMIAGKTIVPTEQSSLTIEKLVREGF